MNEEFAKHLDEEARVQAEKEQKEREEQQRKVDLTFKLAQEWLDNDYDTAELYLK
jgi:hypothetical protein